MLPSPAVAKWETHTSMADLAQFHFVGLLGGAGSPRLANHHAMLGEPRGLAL